MQAQNAIIYYRILCFDGNVVASLPATAVVDRNMDEYNIADGINEDRASTLNMNSRVTTILSNQHGEDENNFQAWTQCQTDTGEVYYLNCASGNNNLVS